MSDTDIYIGGVPHDRAFIGGYEVAQKWQAGEKFFEAKLPIPTDYYLALDLTSNINDKSANAHAMKGNNYSFHNIAGKDCIQFTQGIRTAGNVALGNIITICAEVYCTTINLTQFITELSPNIKSYNAFSLYLNEKYSNRTVHTSDRNDYDYYNRINTYTEAFSLNEWFKVVIVFDRTKTTAVEQRTIYINNVSQSLVSSSDNNVLSDNWGNYYLYIGARYLTTGVLQGYMRNFRLYKRLLTDEERLAIYQE